MPPKKQDDPAALERKAQEDAETAHQRTLVASTFANVQLETTKQTLSQYVALYNSSREELVKLSKDMEDRDRDAMLVVHLLRQDVDRRQEQLKEQRKQAAEDAAAARKANDAEIERLKAIIGDKDEALSRCQDDVKRLDSELDALAAFRRERHDMHMELTRFREDHAKSVEQYEGEISKQRFVSLEEKVKLKAVERDMELRFERDVHDRAMQLLDARTKQIHHENFQLLQDKALVEQELQRITSVHEKMTSHVGELQREIELVRMSDAERTKRTVHHQREIKELKARLSSVEGQLAASVAAGGRTLQELEASHTKYALELRAERDGALSAAAATHKELVKVRALAAQIVKQRTDLETFFNEALDFVRHEIAKERGGAGRGAAKAPTPLLIEGDRPSATTDPADGTTTSGKFFSQGNAGGASNFESLKVFSDTIASRMSGVLPRGPNDESRQRSRDAAALPPISASRGAGAPSTNVAAAASPAGRLDISQLSWIDKERVIRILFAKMSSSQTAVTSTPLTASTIGKRASVGNNATSVKPAVAPPPRGIAAPAETASTLFLTQAPL